MTTDTAPSAVEHPSPAGEECDHAHGLDCRFCYPLPPGWTMRHDTETGVFIAETVSADDNVTHSVGGASTSECVNAAWTYKPPTSALPAPIDLLVRHAWKQHRDKLAATATEADFEMLEANPPVLIVSPAGFYEAYRDPRTGLLGPVGTRGTYLDGDGRMHIGPLQIDRDHRVPDGTAILRYDETVVIP